MIVFKVVNCEAILILVFLLLCDNCSNVVQARQNVKFVEPLNPKNDENQQKHPPTFINIWERVNILSDAVKYKEITQAEKSIRREYENENTSSVQNNKRITRQIRHGYSSIYPALTTPYPSVRFNPTPYRQPTGQHYRATPYTSNFTNYPVHQSYVNNSTVFDQKAFQNTTFNYPNYNSVSLRPAYSPIPNVFYGNSSNSLNIVPRPYNQSKHLYPNTTFTRENKWSSKPKSFNYNHHITNQTLRYPSSNPLGNLILNGYSSNYTHPNLNPFAGRPPFYLQNSTTAVPWLNKTTPRVPVYNSNYSVYNTYNQRINNTINNYQHNLPGSALNGSRLNYPYYSSTNTIRNNTNSPYQWTATTKSYNIPNLPPVAPWSNSSMSRSPLHNPSNSFNKGNQNQWSYIHSFNNTVNMTRNPPYNYGPQSSTPKYPINNFSYAKPNVPSNYPLRTDFQNSTRYNNIPNQNNYMEPNHFFYNPGYNQSAYNLHKDSAHKLSYA